MNYIKKLKAIADIPLAELRPAHTRNYTLGRTLSNTGYRGEQVQPDLIIIHVADGTYGGTLSWFQDKRAGVSAHFTISMYGLLGQSVYERDTAFHSGRWGHNVRSFGIEHEGQPSKGPWAPSEAMYETSARLAAYLCYRYGIPVDRKHIIGHNEVDPDRAARKNCPGLTWNWSKYIGMVRSQLQVLEAHDAKPGHEKDDYNREVKIVNDGGDLLVGRGTLVAGTDKVYLKHVEYDALRLGAPKLDGIEYRKVRIFNAISNEHEGDGYYITGTHKVYIVKMFGDD